MRFVRTIAALGLVAALPLSALADEAKKWSVELELGPTWNPRNDIRIPNPGGTRWSFNGLAGEGAFLSVRTAVTWEGEHGNGWRLLYAPLRITRTGQFSSPVNYDGGTFDPGVPTRGTYMFNSYRLTYRNRWIKNDRQDFRVGFTLKIRDAEVALEQAGASESFSNVGPVPLLHFYGEQKLSDRLSIIADLDAAGAAQGYAIDLGVRAAYRVSNRLDLLAGFRILDGGADNDEVYNFSTFTYAVVGVRYRF